MTTTIGSSPMTDQADRAAAPAATRNGTRITLDRITKDYGLAVPALDDVSLVIEPGEFMTFLGPSGSGKTTTLNLIAGFESLTKGTITLDQSDVSALPPHKRKLGMLFQNYALFPHMTVAQNIGYPLRERKVAKAEIANRVSAALELVQLTGRDDNYPSQLSGGQQQRVALARAIVFNPRALLLDEPLGALDRNLRGALQAEIRRIHRELGSTFVFVTHDQEEAMNLSDRIALFNTGRIEQVGTPEDLYDRPETLFAAKFLGDSTVFEITGLSGSQAGWEGGSWAVAPGTVAAAVTGTTPAALVVRPEVIEVAAVSDPVPSGRNSVRALITDMEFTGGYRTLIFEVGAVTGRARVPASSRGFQIGDAVQLHWSPTEQRIVAA
jgi:putative spermidine/putrescine transport system ATP-binding protein